jgi:hypothetical protein
MRSPCCVALIIVLIIIVVAIVGAWRYVRNLIHKWKTQEGNLPNAAIVDDIGYTSYLPAQLPDPNKFDVDLAAFTIRACESAVNRRLGGDTQLPQGLVEVGWTGGHALILNSVPAKPATGKDLYVIAIAGTLSYEDVRADLNDQLIDFYGTHAHAGFVGTWKTIYPAIEKLAGANPDAQFIVSGHSLGAAVATLVATALGADFPGIQVALYASATPRIGSRDFIDLMARVAPNHWHIANRADIVPTLPLAVSPITSGPNRGKTALYADFDRVVYFDAQSGTLANNHFSGSYLCALVGGKTCSLDIWVVPPQVVNFT